MFCKKCGQAIERGSRFCTICGEPVQQDVMTGEPSGLMPEPNGYVAGGAGNAPYGGNIPPVVYPPYGAQQPTKKRMSKKAKGLMFGGIGLVVVLAIVAVLVFVVFAGGAWPLSGNTVQTRFVNECAKVITGAFSDLSTLKVADISEQPFDMSASVKVKGSGVGMAADVDIDMAYDNLNLGAAADIGYGQMTMLLLEDTLYVDSGYGVTGIHFDSDADLSKTMNLKERLEALTDGSGETADTKRLIEAFLNSIKEDCFKKTGNSFTVQLSEADLQDALETFAEKLNKDDSLREEMERLMETMGQKNADIDEMMDSAIASLDDAEFDLAIGIKYEGGAPTSIVIDTESAGTTAEITFRYEKQGDTKTMTLDIDGDSDYSDGTIELTTKKISGGLELSGGIESYGTSYDFEGSIEKSGDTLSGSFDVSDVGSVEFDCTIKAGMPSKAVEDDRRFKIDTEDADIQDLEDAMGFSMPTMSMAATQPSASEAPAMTEAPVMESDAPVESAEANDAYSIGVILPAADSSYYSSVSDEYFSLAEGAGATVTILTTNYDSANEMTMVQNLISQGIDALIVESTDSENRPQIQSIADESGVYVVFMGGSELDGGDYSVLYDFIAAGKMVGEQCSAGKVCVISSMEGILLSDELESGLMTAFSESGLTYTVLETVYTNFDIEAGKTKTEDLLETYPDANTIVCLDPVAMTGVLDVLKDKSYTGQIVCFVDQYAVEDLEQARDGLDAWYVYLDYIEMTDQSFFKTVNLLNGMSTGRVTYIKPKWY